MMIRPFEKTVRRLARAACVCAAAASAISCGGGKSPTQPGPDAPTVTITAPAANAVVAGSVTIQAAATNTSTVRFFADNVEIAADAEAPYATSWNSTAVADGAHVLEARAEGDGGTKAASVTVTVANQGPPPVTVTVAPAATTLTTGSTLTFTATVTGTANTTVIWSVVEGATHGAISAGGLYTAPATVPSPATATIRATSAADPSATGTATVTITPGGGGGTTLAAEDRRLLVESFGAGDDLSQLASEAVDYAIQAVFLASQFNNLQLTVTGTLTQNPQNPDAFSWQAAPADRMVILLNGVPRIEVVFQAFDGYLDGSWEDFRRYHANLDFNVTIEGALNIRVQSASGDPQRPGELRPLSTAGTTQFQRHLTGSANYKNAPVTIDLTHQGQDFIEVDTGASQESIEETIGTIQSDAGQVNVHTGYRYKAVGLENYVENITRENASTAVRNGVTYAFQNAVVRQAYRNNVVTDTEYWAAQGTLTRDGETLGQIQFEGPVVLNFPWPGPKPILKLTTGEEIPLTAPGAPER